MSDLPQVPTYLQPQPTGPQQFGQWYGVGNAVLQTNLANQQRQIQMQQYQQLQQARAKATAPNATAQDRLDYLTLQSPEAVKSLTDMWSQMDKDKRQKTTQEALSNIAAVQGGNAQYAADYHNQQADALANAGGDPRLIGGQRALAQAALNAPDAYVAQVKTGLLGNPEAVSALDQLNKNDANRREDVSLPFDLTLKDAQAAEAYANALRVRTQAGQVPEQLVPSVNAKVDSSQKALTTAYQYDDLAKKLEDNVKLTGAVGKGWEAIKNLTGQQDIVSLLKTQYSSLRSQGIMSILPPGSASDKDVAIAQGTFPSDDTNPAVIASFMRGMAKIQRYSAARDGSLAQWQSNNMGSEGNARSDFEIDGKPVAKGDTFNSWAKKNLTFDLPLGGSVSAGVVTPGTVDIGVPATNSGSSGGTPAIPPAEPPQGAVKKKK